MKSLLIDEGGEGLWLPALFLPDEHPNSCSILFGQLSTPHPSDLGHRIEAWVRRKRFLILDARLGC